MKSSGYCYLSNNLNHIYLFESIFTSLCGKFSLILIFFWTLFRYIILKAYSQHLFNSSDSTELKASELFSSFQVTLIQELFLRSSYLSECEMMPLLSISVWFSKSYCQSQKARGNWYSHSQSSNLIRTDPDTLRAPPSLSDL